jgi:hypothetical protein
VGAAYNQTLAASGSTPITWDISAGTLPAGLTISTAGVISGTPTTANTYNFTVRATNWAGNATKALSIVVAGAPVCQIGSTNYSSLAAAMAAVQNGQTIKMLADFTWAMVEEEERLYITKNITLDLNGKTVNLNHTDYNGIPIWVEGAGGKLALTNAGALNLTGITGALVATAGGEVTVTSTTVTTAEAAAYADTNSKVTITGNAKGVNEGVIAPGGTMIVGGNVTATGSGSIGAAATYGGNITIDGTITVPANGIYIRVGTTDKTKAQYEATTTKPGYLEYKDGKNIVWVKGTANVAPSITSQPADRNITAGTATSFTVAASGTPAPTYQWRWRNGASGNWADVANGGVYSNAATATLNISAGVTTAYNGYQYQCVATNTAGNATSNTVTLTVTAATVAPSITGPTSMSLQTGYAATSSNVFTVSGNPAPTVTKSGNASITWNNSTKKLDIAAGLGAGSYPVVLTASNGVNPNATITFTLTVTQTPVTNAQAPNITVQPQTTTTYEQNATASALTVTTSVGDGGTLTYQWYRSTTKAYNGTLLGSANGAQTR